MLGLEEASGYMAANYSQKQFGQVWDNNFYHYSIDLGLGQSI